MLTLYLIGAILLVVGLVMTRKATSPPTAYAGIAITIIGFSTIVALAFTAVIRRIWL
jgi:hypothetical protein